MDRELIWASESDAEIRRDDGCSCWPPKQKEPDEAEVPDSDYAWFSAPPPPTRVIAGPEMIMVGNISNRNGRTALMVQFGPATPFTDNWLLLASENLAQWNPRFNFWQVPIKSRTMRSAIKESWALIQDSLLMADWSYRIEFQLRWGQLNQKEINAYGAFIKAMNNFWSSGDMPLIENQSQSLVDLMPMDILYERTKAHIQAQQLKFNAKPMDIGRLWERKSLRDRYCVNYLRHQCTAYESRLILVPDGEDREQNRARFQIFSECNLAISNAYPSLADEAKRQIEQR
ncbi:hypothetical protein Lepto7375DRAFT_1778 [Leptolyngbya sp. PCC 7375]|nr:hypothetical protein Lepto7375DRAFT_1778 [Leptolyngbya sp. PCC 7375]